MKEFQPDKQIARPMPNFEKNEAPVKLNAAAIKREGALLKKKDEEDAKILKEFEYNLRDDSDFNRWFDEMREKDEVERLEHMQKSN
jgi:hypothetical protein